MLPDDDSAREAEQWVRKQEILGAKVAAVLLALCALLLYFFLRKSAEG